MHKSNSQRLSSEQAAHYIGVTPKTLAQWRVTGRNRIPYYKLGNGPRARVVYDVADLDAFLERSKVGGEAA